MKYIKNTLIIIALFMIPSANAKTIGTRTTVTEQRPVQPPRSQPQTKPQTQTKTQPQTLTQTIQQQPEELSPTIIKTAQEIFANYPTTELDNKTQEECTKAAQENKPIFTEEESKKLFLTINDIVKDFRSKLPGIKPSLISDAIINHHPNFQIFKAKLTQERYKDISLLIRNDVVTSIEYQQEVKAHHLSKQI